jgi:hypothetical protein
MAASVFSGQVNPTSLAIAANVLPKIDQLQASADRVRQGDPLALSAASQSQDDPTHGVSRPLAIRKQLITRLILSDLLILGEGVKQVNKRGDRQVVPLHGPGQGDKNRMVWPSGKTGFQAVSPGSQGYRRISLGRLIRKVITPAGVGVDVGQVLP